MKTQLTDLRKELKEIEYTLNSNKANSPKWDRNYYLPVKTINKLLNRAQYIRDVIYNIQ